MLKQTNRTWNIRDEQTIYETMRMYENVSTQFNPFYDELTQNFDFTVGSLQWDKAIREQLRSEGRPAFSYNLIRTVLNVIFSIERDNRKKGKASPRTGGDTELANVITQTLQYYLYHSGFSKAQKRVFMDTIVARLGVYHLGWRYQGSEDETGSLFIEAVDPRGLAWEPCYDDPQWERSSFLFRKHEMSLEEILNTYALRDTELKEEIQKEAKVFFESDPEKGKWVSRKLKQLFSAVYETATGSGRQDSLFKNYLQWWNPGNGKFDILELHEKRMEQRLFIRDSNRNQVIDITEAYQGEFKELEQKEFIGYNYNPEIIQRVTERYQLEGEADVDLVNKKFITAVIPSFNLKVNEQPYPFESKYYVYIPQYCYDTHTDPIKLQSVIDDIKDPQMDFNKARSLILELLARYSNKGWVMDENAIDGLEEDWTNRRITPFRRVRTGYMGLIKPEESPVISPELIRMPMETQQLIKVITNADDEVRGNRSPGVTSGRHFIAKEQRQAKSFTLILENRDNSQKAVYELALDLIQHYVKAQEVIRITKDVVPSIEEDQEIVLNQRAFVRNENGEIEERVVNDVDAYKYDIEITEEPFSASAQEERYNKLGDIFNAALAVNPKKADAMLPIMIRAAGTPEGDKILEAWKQLEQPSPEQQQTQQLMQQIQMIMAKLGIEEKKADVQSKQLDNVKKIEEAKKLKINNIFSMFGGGRNQDNGKNRNNRNKEQVMQ